jgi:hypothetical protein
MIALAAMLAHGSPEPTTLVAPEEPSGTEDLREELRALREALDAERAERRAILEELRRNRPRPARRAVDSQAQLAQVALVAEDQEVDDVVAFGDDVVVRGIVLGDATSFGGDVTIASTGVVHGDAVSFGGRVRVEPGGSVHGDRVGLDAVEATFDSTDADDVGWLGWLYHRTLLLLTLLGAGVLVVGLFPRQVTVVADRVAHAPVGQSVLGAAFTTILTVSCVLFVLLTLGLGAPVSAVGLAVLGAAWLLGFVAVCQVIGDRLPLEDPHGRWAALLAGALLFTFSSSMGLGGTLLAFMVSMLGIGATVSARFGTR